MNNLASALKHELCNVEDRVHSEKSAVKGLQKKHREQSIRDLFGNCSTGLGHRQKQPLPLHQCATKTINMFQVEPRQHLHQCEMIPSPKRFQKHMLHFHY